LKAVESGNALFVENRVRLFAPVAQAFSAVKRFCEAILERFGKFSVLDDGGGKSFEPVECGGVFVAETETGFQSGRRLEAEPGGIIAFRDPVFDAGGALTPCVV
jgi:hypothetical protein